MYPFYESRDQELHVNRNDEMNFPPHLHSQLELIYVEKGRLEVTVEGNKRDVCRGELVVVFPNQVHSYVTEEDADLQYIMVICEPGLAGTFRNTISKYCPLSPFLGKAEVHRDVIYAMRSILRENHGEASPAVYHAFVHLIFGRVMPRLDLVKRKGGESSSIHRVIEHISENFQEPLTLETVAWKVGVNKFHLSRIFSEKLHSSFNDYINSFRIDLAKNLLETSEKSILEISLDCGFDSQRTFNRVFLQKCGMSPRDFRGRKAEKAVK